MRLQTDLGWIQFSTCMFLIRITRGERKVETCTTIRKSRLKSGSPIIRRCRHEPGWKRYRGTSTRYSSKRIPDTAGILRHGVHYTQDWPHGEDIPWDDYSASNIYEPLIKSPEDVEAFGYVWAPPTENDLPAAGEIHDEIHRISDELGIPIQGYAGRGLASLLAVMGAENTITFAIDYPEAFKRLAEIDSKGNVERIRLCALAGVDFIKRFGAYEQANFSSAPPYLPGW